MLKTQEKIPYALASAQGLQDEDRGVIQSLYKLYEEKLTRNLLRDRYYEMKQKPKDLGISVPPNLRNLEQVIGWSAKAVDSLANRSVFEGFASSDDEQLEELQKIVRRTNLKTKYRKAVKSELKHSCSFLTVTSSVDGHAQINAYPATAASALWSDRLARVVAGMVVVDRDNTREGKGRPIWVDMFTETANIELRLISGKWVAEYKPHEIGRCMMEALTYNSTLERPMGTSRISRAVMNLSDSAMRASVRSEISAEFFTSPQKYLLGADEEDALGGMSKWDAYIGNIFAVSRDSEGDVPQFGQLSQGSMQPHIDYMRALAARFSGETNVPINELGVIHDNPSSAEAIYASKEPLVIDAQNLNDDNGEHLINVAYLALAVEHGKTFEATVDEVPTIDYKFKNPARPSVVSQSDAMVKANSIIPWLAESDVALEELGFSDEQIQRLKSDKAKAEAKALIAQSLQNETTAQNGATKEDSQSMYKIMSILKSVKAGTISENNAIKLFAQIGINEDEARAMIDDAEDAIETLTTTASVEGQADDTTEPIATNNAENQ